MNLLFKQGFKKEKENFDNTQIIKRMFLVAFLMTTVGLVIISKIFEITFLNEEKKEIFADTTMKKNVPLRGAVKDRNGKILATNIFKYKLKAYPNLIREPISTSKILINEVPWLDQQRLLKQLSNKSKYEVIILRNITAKKAKYLNSLGIPGLEFFPSVKRFYPHGNLLSHLVGHVNNNSRGVNGIEKTFDATLATGKDVDVTIDVRIQHLIREELLKDYNDYNAKTATAILSNIDTNEIISLVSLPDYNPNLSIDPKINSYRNTATLNLYEMGSTFKVFTIAAALELAEIKLSSRFDATQPLRISRYTIKDYHPQNRVLSTEEVFLNSSNIGASLIALKLGGNSLKKFYNNLGLLDYSSINIKEKSKPKFPKKWGDIQTATLSYGHGISITPIHLVEAASLIFSNYKYEKINLKLQRKNTEKKNNFISKKTREKILHLMKVNVLNGTGKNAFVSGYDVGGKTATAEKIDKIGGGYDKRKLVSSFLSVFPINNPKYVLLVLFDEPFLKNKYDENFGATGGKTAAKTTAKIIQSIAPILGMNKKRLDKDLVVEKNLKGFNYVSF